MTRKFFGGKYPSDEFPAPMYDGMVEVPTPVGSPCLWCHFPIEEGDKGFLTLAIRQEASGPVASEEAEHHECQFRQVVGSVKHQRGECGCATGDFSGDDDAEYTDAREAARAAVREFENRYGRYGETV